MLVFRLKGKTFIYFPMDLYLSVTAVSIIQDLIRIKTWHNYLHISKWLLKSSNILYTFYNNVNFFFMILYFIKNLLLEVGIDLGLLKKTLLKTSKIILMYSNSLARHFSSMFHAKCLLPRLDRLLPVRSCLQNFYQCSCCIN